MFMIEGSQSSGIYRFSRKWADLKALALHFTHYNFCRVHGSFRITPTMAAGITDHVGRWQN